MTPYQLFLAFLYFFIVLVILPIFCSEKVYSVYYEEDSKKASTIEKVNVEHRRKGVQEYLENTDPQTSLSFYESKLSEPVDNLIIILAKKPRHEGDLILSQLVAEVDRNIREQTFFTNGMFICNTTRIPFSELDHLSKFYPIRQSENTTSWKLFNSQEVIKHDFVECINQGRNNYRFKHVTVIRDFVVPYPGFLTALNYVTTKRLSSSLVRGDLRENPTSWLFLHLHEPVPFRHYEFSGDCVREILLLTIFGATLFYLVFGYVEGQQQPTSLRATYTLYGALYFLTFALFIGRPYVSELRRVASGLYRLYDPPQPVPFTAMALPYTSLSPLLTQLNLLRCSTYTPFYEVLDHMVNTLEMPAYVMSPSLFRYVARD